VENQQIEQIGDVPRTMPMGESRVRNAKKVTLKGKPCVYFKDMECRAPVCDMDVCSKCPEGTGICMNMDFMKKMIKRISIFILTLLLFSDV
jgi:hypothetical protein